MYKKHISIKLTLQWQRKFLWNIKVNSNRSTNNLNQICTNELRNVKVTLIHMCTPKTQPAIQKNLLTLLWKYASQYLVSQNDLLKCLHAVKSYETFAGSDTKRWTSMDKSYIVSPQCDALIFHALSLLMTSYRFHSWHQCI